jgi:hypothetical protein
MAGLLLFGHDSEDLTIYFLFTENFKIFIIKV